MGCQSVPGTLNCTSATICAMYLDKRAGCPFHLTALVLVYSELRSPTARATRHVDLQFTFQCKLLFHKQFDLILSIYRRLDSGVHPVSVHW